jgi:hypothetical protein
MGRLAAQSRVAGVRQNMNADGIATFQVLPDLLVRFRVKLSGVAETTDRYSPAPRRML